MTDYCIIHPHHLTYLGIKSVLATLPGYGFREKLYSIDSKDALPQIQQANPRLIIIGIVENNINILDSVIQIKRKLKGTYILLIADPLFIEITRKCLIKGAHGFVYAGCSPLEFKESVDLILKNEVALPPGFRVHPEVIKGRKSPSKLDFELTNREKEILNFISKGLNNKQIADQLFISDQTVAVHRKNLFRKLSVRNSIALIQAAKEKRLID